jgi:DNA polymerase-3 subunit epsilon
MSLAAALRRLVRTHPGSPQYGASLPHIPGATRLADCHFAVVDVETTGLFPRGHDRIIEIAVVQMMGNWDIIDEYSTLVNPGRDVGVTSIHGIGARDIVSAPHFEDIAGDIADRLCDAVLVGHNVEFDLGFLAAELARLDTNLPDMARICTLSLSGCITPPPFNNRLASCCQALGIPHEHCHSALNDASATAKLFRGIIGCAGWETVEELASWGEQLPVGSFPWLKRTGTILTRQAAAAINEDAETYLSRLISRLPLSPNLLATASRDRANVLQYLDLVDRALEDRYVSAGEAEALFDLAREWGMDANVVREAHLEYLGRLARAAVADGVVTTAEREDLISVTRLLSLSESDLDGALEQARESAETPDSPINANTLAGQTVCFTGEMTSTLRGAPISRDMAETLAASAGLVVRTGVSKALDILVTADALTLSTKARKARQYGTRILAESVFWQMIGVQVD